MGSGEVGGNGSVKWTMVHHKEDGTVKPLHHKNGNVDPDDNGVTAHSKAEGKDDIPFDQIGKRPGAPGQFKVTLRYANTADAAAAKAAAQVVGNLLVLYVQAIDRPGGLINEPKEIRLDW